MEIQPRVFISYRRDVSNLVTRQLRLGLESDYQVWHDVDLRGGMQWNDQLISQLQRSDVVVLVIGIKTSDSDWVRREVDIARGLGIWILPVSHTSSAAARDELTKLGLTHTQYLSMSDDDVLPQGLPASIAIGVAHTRASQEELFNSLRVQRTPRSQPAPTNKDAAVFRLEVSGRQVGPEIHVATGNIAKLRGIDVIVNSENNYMQMARFFESQTVSSTLRRLGAVVSKVGIKEDTIQQELDMQLADTGRPVRVTEVIVTSAGLPECELARVNRTRYIFHAASVEATQTELLPLQHDELIEECVSNCLSRIAQVDEVRGVVSPKGTRQYSLQSAAVANYHPIESVILPPFGTGRGGRNTSDVIEAMARAIFDFVTVYDGGGLRVIYLSVHRIQNVPIVEEALSARFNRVS